LIGSTQKMGTGTNVQKRLVALHHLDAPWKPAEVEQREGRILRQGNRNEQVAIYRYVTEGSFDAYMWQALETKARFIAQVITGENAARRAEDIGGQELSYAEVKAIASGNPAVFPLGVCRGLRFGVVLHPQFPPDVYLEGASARQSMLSREHHGPRAVLNAVERLATGYGSECERVRQDLAIAQSQLRDYQARLRKP